MFCIANGFCKLFAIPMAKYAMKSCLGRQCHHGFVNVL